MSVCKVQCTSYLGKQNYLLPVHKLFLVDAIIMDEEGEKDGKRKSAS